MKKLGKPVNPLCCVWEMVGDAVGDAAFGRSMVGDNKQCVWEMVGVNKQCILCPLI